jgi:hypothetical protein
LHANVKVGFAPGLLGTFILSATLELMWSQRVYEVYEVFQLDKCQVVWQKNSTSEEERQAILRELRKMAVELQEAIDFTIKLSNKKPNEVKYWFETDLETDFTLSVYYDAHAQAWGMLIEKMPTKDTPPKVVGEIACKDPVTFRFIEEENTLKTEAVSDL